MAGVDISSVISRIQKESKGSLLDDFTKNILAFKEGSSLEGVGDLGKYWSRRSKTVDGEESLSEVYADALREKGGNISTLMPEVKVSADRYQEGGRVPFIDELIGGGLPYGMEVEEPKAHDEINRLTSDNDFQNIAMDLVMGLVGGGGTKALRAIKARNAKAIRDLTSGVTKGQKTLKPKDVEWLKNQI
jgi:CheY-like chemotaxis protein